MIDHRKNKKLHALYVCNAMEEMAIVRETLQALYDLSRVDASILAGALQTQMAELIKTNTAWQEAAWRTMAGLEAPETDEENDYRNT